MPSGVTEVEKRAIYDATINAGEREAFLIEEPFVETIALHVDDLPARCAADESVHTVDDVLRRAEQGYGAIAIKPAGKTMSLAFEMVRAASEAGLDCFVADNACVPTLVEWNKTIAARLPHFPGLFGGRFRASSVPQQCSFPVPVLANCQQAQYRIRHHHPHHRVIIGQLDSANAPSRPPHAACILLAEANRHSLAGRNEDILTWLNQSHGHKFIIVVEVDRNDPTLFRTTVGT